LIGRLRKKLLSLTAALLVWQPTGARLQAQSSAGVDGGGSAPPIPAPAPETLVERGRYLTLAGNCVSCHTAPGGKLFAGGLAFGTPFGKIFSTNISPDPQTGIGAWTDPQFRRALREGIRPDGVHLYPVFPYTAFTKITDADASALFAYLKTVPPQRFAAPPNDLSFPFTQRWLIGPWNSMFLDQGAYRADSGKTTEWNRGAYLVEALAHCSACHSPRNVMGAERSDKFMTGGVLTDEVPGGDRRPWSTPNLTSAASGLGAWPIAEIVAYLKTGKNSFVTTFGPMNEVIMNSTRHLTDADVRSMAVYLKDLAPNEADDAAAPVPQTLRLGAILYNVYCGTCHLPSGLGSEESAARLAAGSLVVRTRNPASLINVILYGPQLPSPPVPNNRWKAMEAFGDRLSDEDVAALASFVMNAWNNKAGAVTVQQVAQQRQSE
jgi:mono/diheme cytochrome c family protein